MTIESVRTMIETSKTDVALRQQLNAAEGPESVLAIASEKGYQFTEEELLTVMQEKQLSFGEELSEEQLEAVAGGGKSGQGTFEFKSTESKPKNVTKKITYN